jgi:checkpoint serine/threonine-protein kinase
VNAHNGKRERIFVNLREVYPSPDIPGSELSFEEIWAANRGWLGQNWHDEPVQEGRGERNDENMAVHTTDVILLDENGAPILSKAGKPKKKKVLEVNETQIIKAKLDSPSGPKIKKRGSAEPTMTIHTKAATDDIYEIFNQPVKPAGTPEEEEGADEDDYETDGDYTSGAESTGTTRQLSTSEVGGDDEEEAPDETSDVKSVSEWSDFSTRKHIPRLQDQVLQEAEQDELEADKSVQDLLDLREPDAPRTSSHEAEASVHEIVEPEIATPIDEEELLEDFLPIPPTRTSFVPIPPEDYDPPTRPYRDPTEVANNRLPFMTPITERTESSLDVDPAEGDCQRNAKTPSKVDGAFMARRDEEGFDLSALSSPLREIINDATPEPKIAQPRLSKAKASVASAQAVTKEPAVPKGPIIKDAQCNPVSDSICAEILEKMRPPLKSYTGFYDHRDERYERGNEIRKFAKAVAKIGRASVDRTSTFASPVVISFADADRQYMVRKEIGAGAFAPVYLVESSAGSQGAEDEEVPVAMGKGAFATRQEERRALEAIKMEAPPTPWEFHMMRLAQTRLGPQHRATASLSAALEMHLYRDEGFLVLPFHPHGTLLDVVNFCRSEASGSMDELLVMFFAIELLRTVEAMHAKQLLHGDLKPDNCLLRLDHMRQQGQSPANPSSGQGLGDSELSTKWHRSGSGGWASRGLTLIDFGRGIDMRAFAPDVHFIADWKTGPQDCAEMREGRPWTWQIDYHGLAGVVHCLLFGRYIETVRCDAGGLGTQAGRRYKIREGLKRYWQTELWAECFDVLLNPGHFVAEEDGRRMPVLKSMRRIREGMETWLEENCEKGVGLKALMMKIEAWAKTRR